MNAARLGTVAGLLALWAGGVGSGAGGLEEGLLAEFRRGSPEAKRRVVAAGPAAIAPLASMLSDGDAAAAWRARSALRWIALCATDAEAPAERRQQVREAVVPLAQAGQPVGVRRAAFELLGLVGTDQDAALLAEQLGDEALAADAAGALSAIWGHAGRGALCEALGTARPLLKARLLALIASHREADTLPLFAAAAADADEAVRVAALRAVGLLADPRGEATLVDALGSRSARVRGAAFDSLLALAEARQRAGDGPAARRLHEQALAAATTARERGAALAGLGRVGDPASLPKIQAQLGAKTPSVRAAAYAALCQVSGPAGLEAVAAALPEAPAELRPLLLAALGARPGRRTAALLLESAGSPNEATALAAIAALGQLADPAAAPSLLDVAERPPSPRVGSAALGMALRLGHVQADRGQGPAAMAVLTRALRLATSDDHRASALRGMGKVGDPKALDLLRPILEDEGSALRDAAFEACLGIGDAAVDKGDRAAAVQVFAAIADREPPEPVAREAIQKLHGLGVLYDLARRDGAITTWWLIGPFGCRDFRAAGRPRFPERELQLKRVYKVEGRVLRWTLYHSTHAKGWVDLDARLKPNDKVLAYAYTELAIEAERDVELRLGRDDGLTVWLNGQVVYDEHGPHSVDTEEFVVKARLAEGINRILVKSSEGGGSWAFYVRLTDIDGKPLRPTRR